MRVRDLLLGLALVVLIAAGAVAWLPSAGGM
jgi:hypothetical protein